MESLELFLANYWETIPFIVAFLGGLVTFFSPCTFPLLPVFFTYISGVGADEIKDELDGKSRVKILISTLFFILGFSLVYIGLGIGAAYFGNLISGILSSNLFYKFIGLFVIVMGIHMSGLFKFKFLLMDKKLNIEIKGSKYIGAFLIGFFFAFGWSACAGPILALILALAAESGTLFKGLVLAGSFSLGLAIPFILFAFFIDVMIKYIRKINKSLHTIEVVSGVVLIIMGILLFFNKFTIISNVLERI